MDETPWGESRVLEGERHEGGLRGLRGQWMKHKTGNEGGLRGQWMKHQEGNEGGLRGQWMKHRGGMKGA